MQPQGPQGSCGPNEIWSYGETVEVLLTSIVRFRNDVLAPYILELGRNVSHDGVPTVRPLWWEFPSDAAASDPLVENAGTKIHGRASDDTRGDDKECVLSGRCVHEMGRGGCDGWGAGCGPHWRAAEDD